MAYLFIDDNFPEEEEYTTNYIYFNENEPGMLKKMMRKCIRASKCTQRNRQPYQFPSDELNTPMKFA